MWVSYVYSKYDIIAKQTTSQHKTDSKNEIKINNSSISS